MSRPRPTAGHPTLSDACAALAGEGLTSREIGARLSIEPSKAAALAAYRRTPSRTIVVPVDILDALAPHAARRGVSVNRLARDLLDALADGGRALVDNVLDDAADLPPPARKVPA